MASGSIMARLSCQLMMGALLAHLPLTGCPVTCAAHHPASYFHRMGGWAIQWQGKEEGWDEQAGHWKGGAGVARPSTCSR